jgi:hypothetical protein
MIERDEFGINTIEVCDPFALSGERCHTVVEKHQGIVGKQH